jgi:hypothetical protein
MSVIIVLAIILAFPFTREWLVVRQTGWVRLAQKYRCRAPFTGKYKRCWWAVFTIPGTRYNTVASVGHATRWPIRLEFPPYWIAASSQGLHLKRNVWNVLHSELLIPWDKIQSANEITYKDFIRNSSPGSAMVRKPMALHPFNAVAQGILGQILELKLSDSTVSIVAQLAAFEEARRFLGGKLKLLNP